MRRLGSSGRYGSSRKLGSTKAAGLLIIFLLLMFAVTNVFGTEVTELVEGVAGEEVAEHVSNMFATFWALVPPIVAIALALITKEVYISLFVGIVVGALFYANFNVEIAVNTIFTEGFIAKLSDGWNVGILIFLVILGIMVQLINKAGGSAAYGVWANKHIKTRMGAQFATFALGVLIFVDDYFNCLTVGSVMRPVCDRHGISRAKLAYLIDATAAPICMIAPISSWAAAVTGVVEGYNGLELFIKAIPYNFYSLLTITMIITISYLKFDFGSMKVHEDNAAKGDIYTTDDRPYANIETENTSSKGKVYDLIIPVLMLVVTCIAGMVYTGDFFGGNGVSFIDAFANCDASLGLALGSFVSLLFAFVYFLARKVLTFKEFADAIPKGFSAMVPAILILTFAWTLSGMTSLLGADTYVANLVEGSAAGLQVLLPAIIFIIAGLLSFATGTSWGTFGILLPIVVAVLDPSNPLLVITISACLAGAVFGDHCSPISDTTIMASAGAQCNHVNHVSTQLPYALLVAGVSFVFYILAGIIQSAWIVLPLAIVGMVGTLVFLRTYLNKKGQVTVSGN